MSDQVAVAPHPRAFGGSRLTDRNLAKDVSPRHAGGNSSCGKLFSRENNGRTIITIGLDDAERGFPAPQPALNPPIGRTARTVRHIDHRRSKRRLPRLKAPVLSRHKAEVVVALRRGLSQVLAHFADQGVVDHIYFVEVNQQGKSKAAGPCFRIPAARATVLWPIVLAVLSLTQLSISRQTWPRFDCLCAKTHSLCGILPHGPASAGQSLACDRNHGMPNLCLIGGVLPPVRNAHLNFLARSLRLTEPLRLDAAREGARLMRAARLMPQPRVASQYAYCRSMSVIIGLQFNRHLFN
jgi:hypothetical protein